MDIIEKGSTNKMIRAAKINKRFGSREILKDIDIQIESSELVTLLGRNGEGKSTLFRILTGESRPDGGEVFLNEQSIADLSWRQMAKIRSVLPQDSHISFPMRVSEIVELGRSSYTSDRERTFRYVDKAMGLTEVDHLRNRFYDELSGGEKKRVQIARVLCQLESDEPTKGLILLDEPVNSLDVLLQHRIMEILRHLANIGYAIFVILHDWNLAGIYSDRILILDNGKIIKDGSPNQVISSDLLENNFGVSAQIYELGKSRIGGFSESAIKPLIRNNSINIRKSEQNERN
ncbi:heme ABC transporter ATP-binding protein [Leptospira sp. GIMC2001]|uniref:heme ABC transporter ATP-binding protein n=1 Tax=Leptospira sp. GIMC2001 TaxID=1513297 RepID=UPI00234A986C|nr:heme ABC transporter ATP-binding protein [Leptospira sp. GIMC2001]WCL49114.1 heme ABC transporter ATP-binding protein [Leptospira sp. GIMC2001]